MHEHPIEQPDDGLDADEETVTIPKSELMRLVEMEATYAERDKTILSLMRRVNAKAKIVEAVLDDLVRLQAKVT